MSGRCLIIRMTSPLSLPVRALSCSLVLLASAGAEGGSGEAEKMLESLLPDGARVAQLERLIEQLGSERFGERKAAMERLLAAPVIPSRSLTERSV